MKRNNQQGHKTNKENPRKEDGGNREIMVYRSMSTDSVREDKHARLPEVTLDKII